MVEILIIIQFYFGLNEYTEEEFYMFWNNKITFSELDGMRGVEFDSVYNTEDKAYKRIEELEESIDTIKREIKEEIGWDNITYTFLALSEEFVTDKGYNNHQINIIYKGIYTFKTLSVGGIDFENHTLLFNISSAERH